MISLRRNISSTLLGNVIFAACQWAVVSALAKIGGPEQVGVYALIVAITGPLYAFFNMNLRSIQSTDIEEKYSVKQYRNFRFLTSFIALVVCGLTGLVFDLEGEVFIFLGIYSLVKYVESLSDLAYGQYQKAEKMGLVARSLILRGAGSLIAFSLVYYLFNSLLFSGCALLFLWGAVFVFYDAKIMFSSSKKERRKNYFRELAIKAFPLGFAVFCNTLNLNIPRFLISELNGDRELGVYSAVSYFIVAGATIVNAVGQSATPRLARLYKENKSEFIILQKKLFLGATGIGLLGFAVAFVVGDILLSVVYTSDFAGNEWLFELVMLGGAFMYCSAIIGCGLTAMQYFNVQGVLSLLVVVLILTFGFPLVSAFGGVGGALSIVIAYAVKMLVAAYFLFREVSKGRRNDFAQQH
jgi:O-antigen/teichoic acid export membrane protein